MSLSTFGTHTYMLILRENKNSQGVPALDCNLFLKPQLKDFYISQSRSCKNQSRSSDVKVTVLKVIARYCPIAYCASMDKWIRGKLVTVKFHYKTTQYSYRSTINTTSFLVSQLISMGLVFSTKTI